MPTPPSPTIIPFPRARAHALLAAASPSLPELLAGIAAAISAHRACVTDWRASLATSGRAAGPLSDGLMEYRADLAALDSTLARLHREASRLERLASLGSPAATG